MKLSIAVFIASYAATQASPGLRGAEWALADTAVEKIDNVDYSASTSESITPCAKVKYWFAKVKYWFANVVAAARDPPEPPEAGDEETPPVPLFANPIGEDFPVRGFDGKFYAWDDDWDDDDPSDD